MIDISFLNFLQTLTSLPIQQDLISADTSTARVWFQRQTFNQDVFLSGSPAIADTTFAVEVCSLDIDQCQTEATNIRTALNGYRGLMLFDLVLGCFVSDSADEYIPRNLNDDTGFHVASFQVQILTQ